MKTIAGECYGAFDNAELLTSIVKIVDMESLHLVDSWSCVSKLQVYMQVELTGKLATEA